MSNLSVREEQRLRRRSYRGKVFLPGNPRESSSPGESPPDQCVRFLFGGLVVSHTMLRHRHFVDVLQKRPSTPTMKFYAIEYLRHGTYSFQYSESVLARLDTQDIKILGGNEALTNLLDALSARRGREDIHLHAVGSFRQRTACRLSGQIFDIMRGRKT